MKPSEIIREGRDLLFERGWAKGRTQLDDGRVCVVGALSIARGPDARFWAVGTPERAAVEAAAAEMSVDRFIPWTLKQGIWAWNDDPYCTFDQVVEALDRAEKLAEQRETLDAPSSLAL